MEDLKKKKRKGYGAGVVFDTKGHGFVDLMRKSWDDT